MRGEQAVISTLNRVLGQQLVAINQYFLHARMCRHQGFEALNKASYKASIRAMKQADDLIERILFLEGVPNLQELGKLMIGEVPVEMLGCDQKLVTQIVNQLREAVALAEQHQDFVSRALLQELLEEEEEYLDWLETQHALLEAVGVENYLQSQMEVAD